MILICKKLASVLYLIGITLLPISSLNAQQVDYSNSEDLHKITWSSKAVEETEQSGDYASALEVARQINENNLKDGLKDETHSNFSTTKRLEQKLLTTGYSRILFDENNQPRVKLLHLLELVGMDPLTNSDNAIVKINSWVQKNLSFQGERWENVSGRFEELKSSIRPFLKDLGFINATSAHFKEYQGAIVHGALLGTVRKRIYYLVQQWQQGAKFPHVYFLSGERPLELSKENANAYRQDEDSALKIRKDWKIPDTLPRNECEMMQLVWEQADLPSELRQQVQVHYINAPMEIDQKNGKLSRPNTADTVEYWLKANPIPGSYLAITNAPYIVRQDLTIRYVSPNEYTFDTVGAAIRENEKVSVVLDELARCIFQIQQMSEKH